MNIVLKKVKTLHVIEYIMLMLGCFVIALSFNFFLCPNHIASGGIPGLSIVLNKLLGINAAYIQWLINIPLFILGVCTYGYNFGLKTIIGSFIIPFFVLLTQSVSPLSHNLFISSIIGGVGVGLGLGFVFKSRGSVGGFSLVAQIIYAQTRIKLSTLILVINLVVIIMAGFTFNFSGAVYALLSLMTTSVSIDIVQLFCKIILKVE